jgi:hypothetical protein
MRVPGCLPVNVRATSALWYISRFETEKRGETTGDIVADCKQKQGWHTVVAKALWRSANFCKVADGTAPT